MHPALHLLVHRAWRRGAEQGGHLVGLLGAGGCFFRGSQGSVTGLVCRGVREDLEAVGRSQALPPVEQTLPPAVALWHVLLQDGENISPAESQLVGAVRAVVVKRPRQERLGAGGRKKSLLLLCRDCSSKATHPGMAGHALHCHFLSSPPAQRRLFLLPRSYLSLGVTCHIPRVSNAACHTQVSGRGSGTEHQDEGSCFCLGQGMQEALPAHPLQWPSVRMTAQLSSTWASRPSESARSITGP